jgi:hypothetical protein
MFGICDLQTSDIKGADDTKYEFYGHAEIKVTFQFQLTATQL